jgi:uncharacterized protein (TIGR02145 family)
MIQMNFRMKKQSFFLTAVTLLSILTGCSNEISSSLQKKCGAYVAPGQWKEFMCYNLGVANEDADPFTPSWEIIGGYWQWGRAKEAAPGPAGPGTASSNTNAGEIKGWNDVVAPDKSWIDNKKTKSDPCPSGYRVPTKTEWDDVLGNNKITRVGYTWEDSHTNYSTGRMIGEKLFLPAAGYRDLGNGALGLRGRYGHYWSSTENGSSNAWYLGFGSAGAYTFGNYYYNRSDGFSVRCIAE